MGEAKNSFICLIKDYVRISFCKTAVTPLLGVPV